MPISVAPVAAASGAAGKTPFVVAVETTIEGHPLRLKLNAVKGFRKAEIKKLSLRTLVPGINRTNGKWRPGRRSRICRR